MQVRTQCAMHVVETNVRDRGRPLSGGQEIHPWPALNLCYTFSSDNYQGPRT